MLGTACDREEAVEISHMAVAALDLPEIAHFASERGDSTPGSRPRLDAPVYPLLTSDTVLWLAENAQRRLLAWYPRNSGRIESTGGPGEFSAPVGLDMDRQGDVWVADLTNARVSRVSNGKVVAHVNTSEVPLGVVVRDTVLWVLTAGTANDFSAYRANGDRVRRLGNAILGDRELFRYNQGVVSRGNPGASPCAAVVVFSFLPVVRCYDTSGRIHWEIAAPGETLDDWVRAIESGKRRRTDRFAYLDVAQAHGRVIALYSGAEPTKTHGIGGDLLHVYESASGRFIGSFHLDTPVKYIAAAADVLVTVAHRPNPIVRLFEMPPGTWELP